MEGESQAQDHGQAIYAEIRYSVSSTFATGCSTRAKRAFESERGARERKEDFSGAGLSYPPFKQLRLVRQLGRRLYGSTAAGRWGSQKTSHFIHTLDTNQSNNKPLIGCLINVSARCLLLSVLLTRPAHNMSHL